MVRQSPFIINVSALRRAPGSRRHECRQAPLPGLRVTGSAVPDDSDVVADLQLESASSSAILASGTVRAPWVGDCRRCLKEARGEVVARVREIFEVDHDPEETYPLQGDQLDVELLARDAVLLELPLAPLCDENCRGLCPICGTDRNQSSCSCQPDDRDPRWASLDALRDNQ